MLASILLAAVISGTQAPTHEFTIKDGQFTMDGKPFQILAGEMHYARIPRPFWRQRIQMARAMGLNTVSVYCFWNMHEPEKGQFDFKGQQDVAEFIRECGQEGMWVLLRPGPYCCAEWDFGGYPYWLLNEDGLKVRTRDPKFLNYAGRYLHKMADQVASLQVTHGGPILMTQIENEYGSYGKDKEFMRWSRDALLRVGFDTNLFVAEGAYQLKDAWVEGAIAGVNGGDAESLHSVVDKYTPNGPYLVPEFYPGWLDHWGEAKSITDGDVESYKKLLKIGASVSLYMFHGGTNFGFMSGANYSDHFQPDITSYDYDAPLDEAGRPREKYFKFRKAIEEVTGKVLPPVPPAPKVVQVPPFELHLAGSPLDKMPKPVKAEHPLPMERLGQAYGFVLYRARFQGPIQGELKVKDLRDSALVNLNIRNVGTLDRRSKHETLPLNLPQSPYLLDLWVENSGRINYGGKLPDNLKGITESVWIGDKEIKDWEMYSFPMSSPPDLAGGGSRPGGPGEPEYFHGEFKLSEIGEMFLDTRGWGRGVVWVNGHNLGRFWSIGPQQTLYVPSCWLKTGYNKVDVYEWEGVRGKTMQGLAEPILTQLVK